ncbi:hypothetical protein Salpa_1672 [Sporomusa sp. KB1]|jgi:hypothetical protein|nr:hypothetical protein Salpa_1672 [Sporomusa sp. KB1]
MMECVTAPDAQSGAAFYFKVHSAREKQRDVLFAPLRLHLKNNTLINPGYSGYLSLCYSYNSFDLFDTPQVLLPNLLLQGYGCTLAHPNNFDLQQFICR